MRGTELAVAMATVVDNPVNAREGTSVRDRAIESIVGTIGRFGVRNVQGVMRVVCNV